MTWRNKKTGSVYESVDWNWWPHWPEVARVKLNGSYYSVVVENIVEVMEDEPEFDVISDGEVTITNEAPDWAGTGGYAISDPFDPTKEEVIVSEHEREQAVASEPDWPNVHPILREMSYNVGMAYTALTNTVVVKDEDVLYQLQVAAVTIGDEIRRLSEKGANHG